MKPNFILLLLLFIAGTSFAQNLYLKVEGNSEIETRVIDSTGYISVHNNARSVIDETVVLSEKLSKLGYISNELSQSKKPNDSTFIFKFSLGKKTDLIYIALKNTPELQQTEIFPIDKDTITMQYTEVESFLNLTLSKLEKKGYALAKLQLKNIRNNGNSVSADLQLILNDRRQLNDIVINGYDKFPKGHRQNIRRLYRNKLFNQENLKSVYNDFEKFRFIKQTRYPEILFEKDSTKIYVYLEKAKANTFDGFIGFGNNDQQKIIFNGYLDLVLNNILNTGETFTLYWKSDGNDQKTFNASIELPYIFKSPFGLKAQLNIFKQDSTFQNTKTGADLGYFFDYNTRLYLGYQATESSDIQNSNTVSISDYQNSFVTTNFEFLRFKPDDFMFPEKTRVNIRAGIGSRSSKLNTDDQYFLGIDLKHNIYLNEKNSFNLKSQNYYLKSDGYIVNELYRFGGINSIRGFNENSLQANLFSSILTEYRYLLSPGIFVHSIIDYGYFQDETAQNSGNLLGLGFGFGLLTKTGLFNIVYANGSTKDQTIKLSNSIVHISFKATF